METKKGLVLINTGPGKGKTTSALGALVRASGQGLKCLMIQFIKGGRTYGELHHFEKHPLVTIKPTGLGLIGKKKDLEPHFRAARAGWELAQKEIQSGEYDLVILDEVFLAHRRDFIKTSEIAELIKNKPKSLHLILTGRGCPEELYPLADTISYVEAVKHHLSANIKSQVGIEY